MFDVIPDNGAKYSEAFKDCTELDVSEAELTNLMLGRQCFVSFSGHPERRTAAASLVSLIEISVPEMFSSWFISVPTALQS